MFRKLQPKGVATHMVTITVNGEAVAAEQGEPVAAVLLRTHPHIARTTPVSGAPRAPFCMMGACFECLVEIDGLTSTRSCLARVRDGMIVRRQAERPDPMREVAA